MVMRREGEGEEDGDLRVWGLLLDPPSSSSSPTDSYRRGGTKHRRIVTGVFFTPARPFPSFAPSQQPTHAPAPTHHVVLVLAGSRRSERVHRICHVHPLHHPIVALHVIQPPQRPRRHIMLSFLYMRASRRGQCDRSGPVNYLLGLYIWGVVR